MFPQYNYQQAASMWAAANAFNQMQYNQAAQYQQGSMQPNFGPYNTQQQQQQQSQQWQQQHQQQQHQQQQQQQQPNQQQQQSQLVQQPYGNSNTQFAAMPGQPFSQKQSNAQSYFPQQSNYTQPLSQHASQPQQQMQKMPPYGQYGQNSQIPNQIQIPQSGQMGSQQYGQGNQNMQPGPPPVNVQQQTTNWSQQQTQQQNQLNTWNNTQNQQWQQTNQLNQQQINPNNQTNNPRMQYGGQQQSQWSNNRNIPNQNQNYHGNNPNQPNMQNKMYKQNNYQPPQFNQNFNSGPTPHGPQTKPNQVRPTGMNQRPGVGNSNRPRPLMSQFTPGSNQGNINQSRSLTSETKQWVRTPNQYGPPPTNVGNTRGLEPPQPFEKAPPLPTQPPLPKEPPLKVEPLPPSSQGKLGTPGSSQTCAESDSGGEESLASLTEQLETLETQIKTYQADYQKWHQEFVQWQKQHQNHPDQKQYIDYQKKYQKMIEEQQGQLKKQYADLQRKIGERKKITKSSGAAKIAALNLNKSVNKTPNDDSNKVTPISSASTAAPQGAPKVNAAPPVEPPKQFQEQKKVETDQQHWNHYNEPPQKKMEEKPNTQRKNPNGIILRSTLEFVGVKCKFFPGCKFGNTCKFEHGICSAGNSCFNSFCPYEHPLTDVNVKKSTAESLPSLVSGIQNPVPEGSNDGVDKVKIGQMKTQTSECAGPEQSRKRDALLVSSSQQDQPPAKTVRPSQSYTDEVKDPALRMRIDEIYEKRKREILGSSFQEPLNEYERRKREILGDGDVLGSTLPPRREPVDEYERRRREILGEPHQDHSRSDHIRDYRLKADGYDVVPAERVHDYRDLPPVGGDPYLPPRDSRYLPPDPYDLDRGRDNDPRYLERRDMYEHRREYAAPYAVPPVDREIRSFDYGHRRLEDERRVRDPFLERSRSYLRDRSSDLLERPHGLYVDRRMGYDDLGPVDDMTARDSYDRSRESLDLRREPFEYHSERHHSDFDRRDTLARRRDPYDRLRDPYSVPNDFFNKSREPYVRSYDDRHIEERAGPSDYLRRIEERERERNERDGLRDYEMLYEKDNLETSSQKPRGPRIPESELKPEVLPAADILDMPGRAKRPNNVVIILRGIPGSGKSSVARLIKDKEAYYGAQPPRILALDDYFMQETESQSGHGKSTEVKKQEYVYEAELEEAYRSSLLKAFNKTLTDGFFPMVIVDSINDKNKHYDQFWSDAKHKGFEVFIAELSGDVDECLERSIHKRPKEEVQKMIDGWEKAPVYYKRVDVSSLLQDAAIDEVEMEEAATQGDATQSADKKEDDEEEELPTTFHIPKSKWESSKEETLAKLDGFTMKKVKSTESPIFPDDDDEEDDPYGEKEADMRLGKKRVRWADIEQKKHIDHQRKIGFSIGMDWKILTDPNAQIPK